MRWRLENVMPFRRRWRRRGPKSGSATAAARDQDLGRTCKEWSEAFLAAYHLVFVESTPSPRRYWSERQGRGPAVEAPTFAELRGLIFGVFDHAEEDGLLVEAVPR